MLEGVCTLVPLRWSALGYYIERRRQFRPQRAHRRWRLVHRGFEGDSEVVRYEGNHGAYIEDLNRRKGPDADQPHRIKYKKLVRS